jgi:hypothetical protein
MKKIILRKDINHIQLGHLYEHLFAAELAKYFKEQGLYSFVDYHIDAKTFHDGYIEIVIGLFSKEAEHYVDKLTNTKLRFGDDAIAGAILQVCAEKQADIGCIDYEKARQHLKQIDKRGWTIGTEIDYTNNEYRKAKEPSDILEFTGASQGQFIEIWQETIYEPKNDNELAIFWLLSRFLTNNLQEMIADNEYCFSFDEEFRLKEGVATHINKYRVDKRQTEVITDEPSIAKGLKRDISSSSVINRLVDFLSHTDEKPGNSPDNKKLKIDTGLSFTPSSWHRLASLEEISEVLGHSSVRFHITKAS